MAKKNNNVGLNFTADVVDLKTGLKTVQEEIKKADNEFNHNTASLDKWSASSEGLTEKLNQLNTRLNAQKKSVELYQAEIERVSKLEGDHSTQLENLKAKLKDAETAVKKTEKEIGHYSDSLADVTKKEKEENSSLGKLTKTIEEQESKLKDLGDEYRDAVITYGKNSKEAKELKGEISKLSDELKDNKKQVQFADKQLELLDDQFDDTADSAEQFSKGIDGIKDLGSKVAGGLATLGASVGALAGAFLATATESKEFRTNMGKLETGFETSGLKAEQAAETYKNLFAVVADEGKATEAAAMIGQLATSQEDLNKWVNISTGVYATFGDSLPIENLAEAALETSKTGAITGGLADALNWAGISEEKFQESLDACTTEQERQKLITETLNATYDEASRKYQKVNKDVIESNRSQVELSETMAKLGEKAEPILTALKDGFNLLLQEALKLTEGVDFNALAEKIKGGFTYFIDTIIPKIKEGFNWIIENKDVLIAGIVAIGTAMLAWNVVSIVQGVVGAIKGWQAATTGMTTAQALLNTVMNANPIGIIITAVAALTAGFIVLWNKSDAFREFWIGLWDKLKSVVGTVVTWIKENWDTMLLFLMNPVAGVFKYLYENFDGFRNKVDSVVAAVIQFFKDCWSNITDAWSGAKKYFSDLGENISNAFKNIPSKIGEFFTNAWAKVKEAWSTVTTFFSDIKENVIGAFSDLPEKMLGVGKNLVEGLWNGINDMADWVSKKIKGFTDDILGGIKKFFGIHSPSKEMAEIGKFLDEGLAQGVEKNTKKVIKATDNMGEELLDTLSDYESELKKEGKTLTNELASGIEKNQNTVVTATSSLSNAMTNILASSTEEMKLLGEQQGLSYSEGLQAGTETIPSTFQSLTDELGNKLSSVGSKISQFGNDILGVINKSIENQKTAIDLELQEFTKSKEAEQKLIEDTYNLEVEKLKESKEQGLITEEEYTAKLLALDEGLASAKSEIEKAKADAEAEALIKKNELAEKQFNAQKANDIANATIQGALAIVTGFAQLGPIAGAVNAGVQAALTAAQIAVISGQQYVPMLAKGGIVESPTLAMVGEAGKEAIMPLENNLGWISELAEKISAIMQKDYSLATPQMQMAYAGNPTVNNYYDFNQTMNSPKQLTRRQIYRDTKNLLALKGR